MELSGKNEDDKRVDDLMKQMLEVIDEKIQLQGRKSDTLDDDNFDDRLIERLIYDDQDHLQNIDSAKQYVNFGETDKPKPSKNSPKLDKNNASTKKLINASAISPNLTKPVDGINTQNINISSFHGQSETEEKERPNSDASESIYSDHIPHNVDLGTKSSGEGNKTTESNVIIKINNKNGNYSGLNPDKFLPTGILSQDVSNYMTNRNNLTEKNSISDDYKVSDYDYLTDYEIDRLTATKTTTTTIEQQEQMSTVSIVTVSKTTSMKEVHTTNSKSEKKLNTTVNEQESESDNEAGQLSTTITTESEITESSTAIDMLSTESEDEKEPIITAGSSTTIRSTSTTPYKETTISTDEEIDEIRPIKAENTTMKSVKFSPVTSTTASDFQETFRANEAKMTSTVPEIVSQTTESEESKTTTDTLTSNETATPSAKQSQVESTIGVSEIGHAKRATEKTEHDSTLASRLLTSSSTKSSDSLSTSTESSTITMSMSTSSTETMIKSKKIGPPESTTRILSAHTSTTTIVPNRLTTNSLMKNLGALDHSTAPQSDDTQQMTTNGRLNEPSLRKNKMENLLIPDNLTEKLTSKDSFQNESEIPSAIKVPKSTLIKRNSETNNTVHNKLSNKDNGEKKKQKNDTLNQNKLSKNLTVTKTLENESPLVTKNTTSTNMRQKINATSVNRGTKGKKSNNFFHKFTTTLKNKWNQFKAKFKNKFKRKKNKNKMHEHKIITDEETEHNYIANIKVKFIVMENGEKPDEQNKREHLNKNSTETHRRNKQSGSVKKSNNVYKIYEKRENNNKEDRGKELSKIFQKLEVMPLDKSQGSEQENDQVSNQSKKKPFMNAQKWIKQEQKTTNYGATNPKIFGTGNINNFPKVNNKNDRSEIYSHNDNQNDDLQPENLEAPNSQGFYQHRDDYQKQADTKPTEEIIETSTIIPTNFTKSEEISTTEGIGITINIGAPSTNLNTSKDSNTGVTLKVKSFNKDSQQNKTYESSHKNLNESDIEKDKSKNMFIDHKNISILRAETGSRNDTKSNSIKNGPDIIDLLIPALDEILFGKYQLPPGFDLIDPSYLPLDDDNQIPQNSKANQLTNSDQKMASATSTLPVHGDGNLTNTNLQNQIEMVEFEPTITPPITDSKTDMISIYNSDSTSKRPSNLTLESLSSGLTSTINISNLLNADQINTGYNNKGTNFLSNKTSVIKSDTKPIFTNEGNEQTNTNPQQQTITTWFDSETSPNPKTDVPSYDLASFENYLDNFDPDAEVNLDPDEDTQNNNEAKIHSVFEKVSGEGSREQENLTKNSRKGKKKETFKDLLNFGDNSGNSFWVG